jgi:tripartite-type tricarboxylate transporter receptor subunit TctC
MIIDRRQFLYLVSLLVAPGSASSQNYPTRPLLFIVPLAAGGGLDFLARLIGEYISRTMGQQVVVENRTGAGGTIGIEEAARSPPDGYTILISNDNISSAPHILPVNGNYLTDLLPIIEVARQPLILCVHPSLGVGSLADLIRVAKQRPGLGYATSGVGSNQHVLGEWFKKVTDIELEHVPYRGAGQAINDLVGGHVPIGILGPTALIPYYKSGDLRLLAQSSRTRSPILPDIPTFQEAGVSGIELDAWYGVFVPAGSPGTIISRLNSEINIALADPATRTSLLQAANEPVGGSAEQLSEVFRENYEKYGRLVRELNIKAR